MVVSTIPTNEKYSRPMSASLVDPPRRRMVPRAEKPPAIPVIQQCKYAVRCEHTSFVSLSSHAQHLICDSSLSRQTEYPSAVCNATSTLLCLSISACSNQLQPLHMINYCETLLLSKICKSNVGPTFCLCAFVCIQEHPSNARSSSLDVALSALRPCKAFRGIGSSTSKAGLRVSRSV